MKLCTINSSQQSKFDANTGTIDLNSGTLRYASTKMQTEENNAANFLLYLPPSPRLESSLSMYSQRSSSTPNSNTYTTNFNHNPKKPKRRAVSKKGASLILHSRRPHPRCLESLQDFVTTLVNIRWHWTLSIFSAMLLLSWLGFAAIWWLICYTHGDFEHEHLPQFQNSSHWKPCLHQVKNFMSCFMFSIETQHTVGYGIKAPTGECPEATFVNVVQCNVGVVLQGLMSGIIFAKMTLPKKRSQTVLFSRCAVICLRDGVLSLQFRVGDMRKHHGIILPQIKAFLVQTKRTREGELLRHQTPLPVSVDGCAEEVFFIWPMVAVHKIDAESPLFDVSPVNLVYDCFEVVVLLEGTIQSTGQSMQARTSYTATEIVWGHRFKQVLEFDGEWKEWRVDFSKFHDVEAVDTPLVSAREFRDRRSPQF